MEKVGAVELLAVGLHHRDPVLSPLEYLHLVHREDVGPGEVSLPVDVDSAVKHIQTDHLIEVRVLLRNIKYCPVHLIDLVILTGYIP